MSWLAIIVLAYFIMAIISLFDRYFLVGPMADPRIYTFNAGFLWMIFSLPLLFLGLHFPSLFFIALGLSAGFVRFFALFFLSSSISKTEISRVVPIVGSLQPIFSFLLFFPQSRSLALTQLLAFLLLVLGSILISLKKSEKRSFNFENLKYPLIASLLYACTFFLLKNAFLGIDFWSGVFLTLLGGGVASLLFLTVSGNRKAVFCQKRTGKTSGLFVFSQGLAGVAIFLQYYAVFLAKPGQVPLINALEGTRYVFLFFLVLLVSRWKPSVLKEENSRETLILKAAAIVIICLGLALLNSK
jgi:uncharacterized membrane protein